MNRQICLSDFKDTEIKTVIVATRHKRITVVTDIIKNEIWHEVSVRGSIVAVVDDLPTAIRSFNKY